MPNLLEIIFYRSLKRIGFSAGPLIRRWEIFSQERGHSAPKGFEKPGGIEMRGEAPALVNCPL